MKALLIRPVDSEENDLLSKLVLEPLLSGSSTGWELEPPIIMGDAFSELFEPPYLESSSRLARRLSGLVLDSEFAV